LPNVLTQAEVLRLLSGVQNLKHRAILYLTYSSGLRVGEVVRLRAVDLDPARKTLHIRQGKGRKDRFTLLSDAAYALIRTYLASAKPTHWLFPGNIRIVICQSVRFKMFSSKRSARRGLRSLSVCIHFEKLSQAD